MKEHIAYKGNKFIVEWFYDSKDKSQALDYYKALSIGERIKVLRLFKRIGDVGEIKDKTKFNYEGEQIYAFKPQPERFLCFFYAGKKIIVVNAFRKKEQKLPSVEKNKAIKGREDYMNRIKKGNYYAKN